MRILRAEHVYNAPLSMSDDERRVRGIVATVDEIAAVPLAARAAVLHRNEFAGGALAPADLPAGTLDAETVAYVNGSRWVADCPTPGCDAALVVSPDDPRFLCPICWQGYYPVAFPSDDDVAAIEDALLARPAPQTRNWIPGETVAELREETAANVAANPIAPPVPAETVIRRMRGGR